MKTVSYTITPATDSKYFKYHVKVVDVDTDIIVAIWGEEDLADAIYSICHDAKTRDYYVVGVTFEALSAKNYQ